LFAELRWKLGGLQDIITVLQPIMLRWYGQWLQSLAWHYDVR